MQVRNRLEDLLIATLGACSECRPSGGWLGRAAYAPTPLVRPLEHPVGRRADSELQRPRERPSAD
jgi:hypothetical protein